MDFPLSAKVKLTDKERRKKEKLEDERLAALEMYFFLNLSSSKFKSDIQDDFGR
jgi:hypothetical protein